MRQIRAAGAYLEDPEVNDYLNELGHRLVAAMPEGRQEFEFFAVADLDQRVRAAGRLRRA